MKRLPSVTTAAMTALALCTTTAWSAHMSFLSAGAIELGIKAAAAAFEKQIGHRVKITCNTAPELRERMEGNPAFDVVLAPPAVINDFAAANQLAAVRSPVGRVGTCVAVRTGAPVPDIASNNAVK